MLCWVLGVSACAMAVVALLVRVTGRTLSGPAPAHAGPPWQRYVDVICAGGSAAAFLFLLFSTAEAAIILTIVTDAIAAIPTVVAAWCAPRDQPYLMYFGIAVSSAVAVIAGGTPTRFIDVSYPIYVYLLDVVIVGVILGRAWWSARPARYVDPPTIPIVGAPPGSPFAPKLPWPSHPETAYDAYVRATLATRPPLTGADRP